jgi:hypothetical protein
MVENKKDSSHLSISMINLKRSAVLGILVILLLVAIGAASYFYLQFAELKKNPQRIAQQEVQELVSKVSKLIVLPEGETPTVATVTDPEKLKDQPFFAKTKKGDKILIYTNAKKAILYDPVNNKIVEVAPVNIGGTATPSPSPTPSP